MKHNLNIIILALPIFIFSCQENLQEPKSLLNELEKDTNLIINGDKQILGSLNLETISSKSNPYDYSGQRFLQVWREIESDETLKDININTANTNQSFQTYLEDVIFPKLNAAGYQSNKKEMLELADAIYIKKS